MNKLKNVFQRSSQKIKTAEDRRPQQFVKRHSVAMSTLATTTTPPWQPPPAINLSDLSEMEKPAYQSWWKDLDPFDLQKINNQTILKFLNGCSLPDNKLEQILALFETAGDGLNKLQFFAMLRLIAHAQNGRKISRALVYLGAPIPHFHTNAIDALINKSADKNSNSTPTNKKESMVAENRKLWWGNEKQQMDENDYRNSYMGPFIAHTPIPNSPYNNNYFYPLSPPTNTALFSPTAPPPQWLPPPPPPTTDNTSDNTHNLLISTGRPVITSSLTTTAIITPITSNIIQAPEKGHSRSKSAGTASDFIQSFNNPYQSPPSQLQSYDGELQSSRSSLSLHELNTGQSLLLTQKFVYQSPSVRNQELLNSNSSNPFHITTPTPTKEDITSPFDDNHSSSDNEDELITTHINYKPNMYCIPPPPVPNQSKKPAFPKYTRTNTFLIKRSASTTADNKRHYNNHTKHQRHKSTSAFY